MEKIMNELIEEIKKDNRYIHFKNSEKKLSTEEELIKEYRKVLDEYQDMKKYEEYVDISDIKDKLKAIKQKMGASQIINEYYSDYHHLNDFLNEITQLIFAGISDDLLISQYDLG